MNKLFILHREEEGENGDDDDEIEDYSQHLAYRAVKRFYPIWPKITGNAFLYHMVRRIVHVLVLVGQGKQDLEIVKRGLETGSTGIVDLAPARGLTLTRVRYPEDE